jgi:DNA (cytosine-5)-methyltransferase 1
MPRTAVLGSGVTLELFSCSGGMAEGFRRAGIEFDWVVDWDPEACASYETNLGRRTLQIDARDLLDMVRGGWTPGTVALLVADPPCTPWSRAGKRLGTADGRDMLRETCELVALLRPQAYLIGNVPGLQDASSWHVVQEVIGGLSAHGYCTADFAQLDAADYGVPQRRIRPFWYGHRGGPCIRWPARTHCDPAELASMALPGVASLQPWVTCREALAGFPAAQLGKPVRVSRRTEGHPPNTPDAPSSTIRSSTIRSGGDGHSAPQVLLAHARHPISTPDAPSYTVTTKGAGRGAQGACVVGGWPWDRPATTVMSDPRIPPPGHHGTSFLTGANAIVLSERAAAVLQGFPDGWTFEGKTKRSRWAQIGMAMPPPLAAAVAQSVAEALSKETMPLREGASACA